MVDKYSIAKKIFDDNIAKIELSYVLNKVAGQDYICKTPEQTVADGHGFCTEQVELAESLLKKQGVFVDKYQVFATPPDNKMLVKIDLAHSFIGIQNDREWLLFETGFRARNRGGVKRFPDEAAGLRYVLKLYNQSLIIAGITEMEFSLYQYNFTAVNQTFSKFANQVLLNAQRVKPERYK